MIDTTRCIIKHGRCLSEEWRPLFWGCYSISNYGNIRRVLSNGKTRDVKLCFVWRTRKVDGVKCKENVYADFSLQKIGIEKHKRLTVSKLVANTFIRYRRSNELVVHKNGDNFDNRYTNLTYTTINYVSKRRWKDQLQKL